MSKSVRNGGLILLLAFLVLGCATAEEKLAKDEVDIQNKMAEAFEKVTDKASMTTAYSEMAALADQIKDVAKKLNTMPGRDAAREKYKSESEAARERLGKAKAAAVEKTLKN